MSGGREIIKNVFAIDKKTRQKRTTLVLVCTTFLQGLRGSFFSLNGEEFACLSEAWDDAE
jgi:hypothetical protein